MRRRVFLHGSLREIHPEPIEVEADTVADAIKLVTRQLPGFRPNAKTGYRRIKVVGCESVESLFQEGPEELHFIPQFNGGKNGGFFQIIIGAALIAASFLVPGGVAFLAPMLMQAGVLLMLGGVLQLLQAPPTTKASHYLGNPQNTVEIGTPIPILYGHRMVGGQFLSLNIAAVSV